MNHKQLTATRVHYEYVINEMDGEDIAENFPHDSVAEMMEHIPDEGDIQFEIWKLVGSHSEGITDRTYAAITSDGLQPFDDGSDMPLHVSRQFTASVVQVIRDRLTN